MTDKIVDFTKLAPAPAAAPEVFDYVFRDKDDVEHKYRGDLRINPLFVSIVDDKERAMFLLPFDQLHSFYRVPNA